MSLGNEIKIKNKKNVSVQKVKTLELNANDEAILKGILILASENVGKFGLAPDQVGNAYNNCHTFINIINSLPIK